MTALTYHPDRSALIAESHLRPFRPVATPSRLSFMAFLRSPGQASPMAALIAELCADFGLTPPDQHAVHFSVDLGLFQLRWERHTEFDSLQVFGATNSEEVGALDFSATVFDLLPKAWVKKLPASCFLSAHLHLLQGQTLGREDVARYAQGLVPSALVISHMQDEKLTFLTDFCSHADGFQRLLIINEGANPYELGRTVQRLVEIETYRALVLLANPLVRAQGPLLSKLSQELSTLVRALDNEHQPDSARGLLKQALKIEAELGRLEADTAYRLSATGAYAPLVIERLERLKESRLIGWQRYSSFLMRRLAPAERAAVNLDQRITNVQDRAKRIVALLQAQISVQVEVQNQQLLSNMKANARKQLRLQRSVELIGAVAITYYAVSVVAVLLKPLHLGELETWLKAGAIPVFLLGTLYLSHLLAGHGQPSLFKRLLANLKGGNEQGGADK